MFGDNFQLPNFYYINVHFFFIEMPQVPRLSNMLVFFSVFWSGIQLLSTSLYRWFLVTAVLHCINLKSWAEPVALWALRAGKVRFLTDFYLEVCWYLNISKLWQKCHHAGRSVHLCGLVILRDATEAHNPSLGVVPLCLYASRNLIPGQWWVETGLQDQKLVGLGRWHTIRSQ